MTSQLHANQSEIIYPESDGQPMADNTQQFEWIVLIKKNLDWLFLDDPTVFVAGDLLWYPIEGDNKTCAAPDAMVVFGRPKGDRGSYQQWNEGNIAPQVVFEILSPGNTPPEMDKKRLFYQRHGVEEYYLYDPDRNLLRGWLRSQDQLTEISPSNWISPRLGIRFDLSGEKLQIFRPDGDRFQSYEAIAQRVQDVELELERERQQVIQERQRGERLAERLRALEIDPDRV